MLTKSTMIISKRAEEWLKLFSTFSTIHDSQLSYTTLPRQIMSFLKNPVLTLMMFMTTQLCEKFAKGGGVVKNRRLAQAMVEKLLLRHLEWP